MMEAWKLEVTSKLTQRKPYICNLEDAIIQQVNTFANRRKKLMILWMESTYFYCLIKYVLIRYYTAASQ